MSTFLKIIGTDKFVGGTNLVIGANKLKLNANWNLTADNTGEVVVWRLRHRRLRLEILSTGFLHRGNSPVSWHFFLF